MMFAFAACFAFCAYRAPHILATLSRLPRVSQRVAFVSTIAVALALNVFADPAYIIGPVLDRQGGPGYREAIRVASRLPGFVVSPDDPTIPLYAKGYAGTQAHVEADASKWAFPERVSAELSRANFAIQLDRTVGRRWLSDSVLVASGFVQQKSELDGKGYRIWSKTGRGRPE